MQNSEGETGKKRGQTTTETPGSCFRSYCFADVTAISATCCVALSPPLVTDLSAARNNSATARNTGAYRQISSDHSYHS